MKVIELLEYKNKYYKAVGQTPNARGAKTLWYNNYRKWVGDIRARFPDTSVFYDEENEEIIAAADDSKECYGKWIKKNGGYQGVTFFKARSLAQISRNGIPLKKINLDDESSFAADISTKFS